MGRKDAIWRCGDHCRLLVDYPRNTDHLSLVSGAARAQTAFLLDFGRGVWPAVPPKFVGLSTRSTRHPTFPAEFHGWCRSCVHPPRYPTILSLLILRAQTFLFHGWAGPMLGWHVRLSLVTQIVSQEPNLERREKSRYWKRRLTLEFLLSCLSSC